MLTDTAKVTTKGQITIPKAVREHLGVTPGDRVVFIVDGDSVRVVNSAVFAMQTLQAELQGDLDAQAMGDESSIEKMVSDLRK